MRDRRKRKRGSKRGEEGGEKRRVSLLQQRKIISDATCFGGKNASVELRILVSFLTSHLIVSRVSEAAASSVSRAQRRGARCGFDDRERAGLGEEDDEINP